MATGMSDRIAKPDYAAVHLALARWRLEHPGEDPPPDEPIALFDDQALDDASAPDLWDPQAPQATNHFRSWRRRDVSSTSALVHQQWGS